MKRFLILSVSILTAVAMITSCAKESMVSEINETTVPQTRAFGDKTPKVMVYIEVNDTNPLNAMLYRMDGEPFIDIVSIFAANPSALSNAVWFAL